MDYTLAYIIGFVFVALASHQIGRQFSRINLPYITGYLLAGVVAGPFVLNLLPTESVEELRFIDEISLAVIAFVAGTELYLKELQGRFRTIIGYTLGILIAASVFGSVAIFFLTTLIPFTADMAVANRIAVAVLGSTILLALSPPSTIAVIKEVRAKGPFTRTLLGVTVSMDVAIVIFFAISSTMAGALIESTGLDVGFVLLLVFDLVLAVALGLLSGKLLEVILGARLSHDLKTALVLVLGYAIFSLTSELATFSHDNLPFELHPEPLLISLIGGFWITNFSRFREEFDSILHDVGPIVYVAFFTLTGVALKLDVLIATLPIALVLFVVRVMGIFTGSYTAGRLLGETERINRIAWMGFITQAGIALGLAREVSIEFPSLGNDFATMIIAVIVLNEVFGPLFLKSALRRAGESALESEEDAIRDAVIFGVEGQSIALARQLKAHNWQVVVADTDESHIVRLRTEEVRERHLINLTDETITELLRGTTTADAVVAMMPDDDINLQICEVASRLGVRRIVVRVNDLANEDVFQGLGAFIVDSATAMISLLEQYVRAPQAAERLTRRNTQYEIVQVTVTNPTVHNTLLRDLRLANDVLILEIQRDGSTIVPHGYHALHLDDEVTLIGKPASLEEVTLRLGY
ncbi:MAG: cation:proton antiporter [Anaerolineae bacterium]